MTYTNSSENLYNTQAINVHESKRNIHNVRPQIHRSRGASDDKFKKLRLSPARFLASLGMFVSLWSPYGFVAVSSTNNNLSPWCTIVCNYHLVENFVRIRRGGEAFSKVGVCMWSYCGHFQLHMRFWPLDRAGGCQVLIFIIDVYQSCRFSIQVSHESKLICKSYVRSKLWWKVVCLSLL